jgi:ribose transport system permease protein
VTAGPAAGIGAAPRDDKPGRPLRGGVWPATLRMLKLVGERYALIALFVIVCVTFSLLPSTRGTFPTVLNIRQVLSGQSALIIVTIGEIFPLLTGGFDLSIGAVCTLSAVVCATAMSRFGLPLGVALLLGVGSGVVIGVVNGLLIARARLNSIMVTLGMSTLLTGLVTWYTQGNDILTGISQTAINFGTLLWLGIPRPIYLVVVVVVVSWYLLGHTPFGRYVHAIGSNTRAAHLVGINIPGQVLTCYVISGALSGVAGVLTVAVNGGAVVTLGEGLLFPALTAVFLGATVFTVGRFNVLGAVIGVVFVAASVSGLTLVGASSWVNDVFNGAALIVAVGVSTLVGWRNRR